MKGFILMFGTALDSGHVKITQFILERVLMLDLKPCLIMGGGQKTPEILCKSFKNVLPVNFSTTLSVFGVQKHGLFLQPTFRMIGKPVNYRILHFFIFQTPFSSIKSAESEKHGIFVRSCDGKLNMNVVEVQAARAFYNCHIHTLCCRN